LADTHQVKLHARTVGERLAAHVRDFVEMNPLLPGSLHLLLQALQ